MQRTAASQPHIGLDRWDLPRELRGKTGIYALNEEPHPQVLLVFGFSNLKPEASSVSR